MLLSEPEKALLTQESFNWVISGENLSGELPYSIVALFYRCLIKRQLDSSLRPRSEILRARNYLRLIVVFSRNHGLWYLISWKGRHLERVE